MTPNGIFSPKSDDFDIFCEIFRIWCCMYKNKSISDFTYFMNYHKYKIKAVIDIARVIPRVYRYRSRGYNWRSIGIILEQEL